MTRNNQRRQCHQQHIREVTGTTFFLNDSGYYGDGGPINKQNCQALMTVQLRRTTYAADFSKALNHACYQTW